MTRVRCGVTTNVGRIVPWRNSLVIAITPISAAKSAAEVPAESSACWLSCVTSSCAFGMNPLSSTVSRMSAIIPASRPRLVRVERILRSSASSWSVMTAPPRSARGRRPRGSTIPTRVRRAGCRLDRRSRRRGRLARPPPAARRRRAVLRGAPRFRASACSLCAPGARTRTAPVRRAVSSASGEIVTSRPLLMMMTSSTVCATSASTWLETKTVFPSAAKLRRKSRSQRTPSGSSPLAGSSRISNSGSPSSAAASPSRCRIPSE